MWKEVWITFFINKLTLVIKKPHPCKEFDINWNLCPAKSGIVVLVLSIGQLRFFQELVLRFSKSEVLVLPKWVLGTGFEVENDGIVCVCFTLAQEMVKRLYFNTTIIQIETSGAFWLLLTLFGNDTARQLFYCFYSIFSSNKSIFDLQK